MHIAKTSIRGNPNVGLFGLATDKFLLASADLTDTKIVSDKVFPLTFGGTDLVGLFAAGNSNGIVVPYIINRIEREALAKVKKALDINILELKCKETAMGNLIVANDKGAIISGMLKKDANKISDALGVEVSTESIVDMDIPGSYCAATNKGFLLTMIAEEADYDLVKSVLKVDGDIGSVNFGSPFVSSGVLANSKGVLVGAQTTGFELARVDESFGFIKR